MHDVLKYDPITGIITYKVTLSRSKQKGDVAGRLNAEGYIRIDIHSRSFLAHRLAIFLTTGLFPADDMVVDHINHSRSDNRFANLREVTQSINIRNSSIKATNSSGAIGISWNSANRNWRARIKVDYKTIELGSFIEFSDAVNARKNAEVLYGFHENHGKQNVHLCT